MNFKSLKLAKAICLSAIVAVIGTTAHGGIEPTEARYRGLETGKFLREWLALRPIPISTNGVPDELAQRAAFAADLSAAAGGLAGGQPQAGQKVLVDGRELTWELLVSPNDFVTLLPTNHPRDFCIGYASAEIEMERSEKVLLGLGSDDAVKVWLNGNLIHENWTRRTMSQDQDLAMLPLQKGRNRLLIKLQNGRGTWNFECRRLDWREKMVEASRNGRLDTVQQMLAMGFDVNAKDGCGLTPWLVATLEGREALADFLVSKGARREKLPDPEKWIDARFKQLFPPDAPGAAVLIARNGKVIFKKGYGLANVEEPVPVTTETRFRIASITKQLTAAGILKLQEQGRLNVNDALSKFLPGFPRGDEVTLHHLLTHTSGMVADTTPEETAALSIRAEEVISSVTNKPYYFDPGAEWAYNSSGYFLLGYILEQVSGKTYADFLRRQIFTPLQMNSTGVAGTPEMAGREAHCYFHQDGKWQKAVPWDSSRLGGAGALSSTVEDLFRWNEALFSGRALNDASMKAALTRVVTSAPQPGFEQGFGYGYGLQFSSYRGLKEIYHGGFAPQGVITKLLRVPDEGFTVVILINGWPRPNGVGPEELSEEILTAYFWRKMKAQPTFSINKRVAPETYNACVGRYDYGKAIVTARKGRGQRLFVKWGDESPFEVFPMSETEFFSEEKSAHLNFVKNEKGVVTRVEYRQGDWVSVLPRLLDVDPAAIDGYVGRYDFGENGVLTVTRAGSRLRGQLGEVDAELIPRSDTEFFWWRLPFRIHFVKDATGKIVNAVYHKKDGSKIHGSRMD